MYRLKRFGAVLMVLCLAVSVFAVGGINTANAEFSETSYKFSSKLGVGFNIGNSLDSTDGETSWGNPKIIKALVTAIKNMGYKTVRIPVTWVSNIDSEGHPSDVYLSRVKEVVDYAYSQDMYVIINTHHEMSWLRTWWANSYGEENTAKLNRMIERFGVLWSDIAAKFRDYGERLIFEGYNETRSDESNWSSDPLSRTWLGKIGQKFVDVVRADGGNNASRYLLLNTYAASGGSRDISKFIKPQDPANHYMLGIHAYIPADFCFPTSISNSSNKTEFDSDAQTSMENYFGTAFGYAKEYFIDQGLGVVLGELGAIDKNNDAERVKYATAVVEACVKSGVVPVIWENGFDATTNVEEPFGLINRNTCEWTHESVARAYTSAANGLTFGSGVPYVTNPPTTKDAYENLNTPPSTTAPDPEDSAVILRFDTEESYSSCWGQAQGLEGGSLNANGILLTKGYVKATENGGLRMSSLGLGCNCLQQQLHSRYSVVAQSSYSEALDMMGEETDNRVIRFSVTNNGNYNASFWINLSVPGVTTLSFTGDNGKSIELKPGQTKIVMEQLPSGYTFDRLTAVDSTIYRAGINVECWARCAAWNNTPIDIIMSPIYLVDSRNEKYTTTARNAAQCLYAKNSQAGASSPANLALGSNAALDTSASKLRFKIKGGESMTLPEGLRLRTSTNGAYVADAEEYKQDLNITTEWQTVEIELTAQIKSKFKSFAFSINNRKEIYFDDFEYVMSDGTIKTITNFNSDEPGIYSKLSGSWRGTIEVVDGGAPVPTTTTTTTTTTTSTTANPTSVSTSQTTVTVTAVPTSPSTVKPTTNYTTAVQTSYTTTVSVSSTTGRTTVTASKTAAPDYVPGDVNCDGRVNITDLLIMKKCLAVESFVVNYPAADINGDRAVNIRDLMLMKKIVATL